MTDTPITVTLPLTQTGAYILLTALGIAAATGLVYLTLYGQEAKARPNPAMDWLTALGWAMVPVWFTLLGGTLWHLWLLATTGSSFLTDSSFGLGAVIAAFLGGPFVIWGTVLKQKTVEFQKESHITERISKAVEQLGEEKTVKDIVDGETVERTVPNIEVRIGGLLSLERIAQDSTNYDKGRDHVRVMEILCAYVRENAPASGAQTSWRERWEEAREGKGPNNPPMSGNAFLEHVIGDPAGRLEDYIGIEATHHWARSLPKPRADIALALQIIGRRSQEQRRVEAQWGMEAAPDAEWVFETACPVMPNRQDDQPHAKVALDSYLEQLRVWNARIQSYRGYRLDLRSTNLQGINFGGGSFSGTDFSRSRLDGAELRCASLVEADFSFARMYSADFFLADMPVADFDCAVADGSDFSRANMQSIFANRARFRNSKFSSTEMVSAYCFEGSYDYASFMGTNLCTSDFMNAALRNACFSNARLEQAHFDGANLGHTILSDCDVCAGSTFHSANLRGLALREMDLSAAQLQQEELDQCFGDGSTKLPSTIEKPRHWPKARLQYIDLPETTWMSEFHAEWRKWRTDPATYTPPPKPAED